MEISSELINQYAERHTSPESPLLQRINRETYAEVLKPRMLSGHLQGQFLSTISRLLRPQNILEIGTYTGYSALCLTEGLPAAGRLTTIDINEELESRVREYFLESGRSAQIDYRIGDAIKLLPGLAGPFQLVWIDADKENYAHYFDLVVDKVPSGGCILADNVLWSGKVLGTRVDKDTKALQEFNNKVCSDPRVKTMLLPLRDGIMMMTKN